MKFPHEGKEITIIANSSQYCNNLKPTQDTRVPHNRELVYPTKEVQAKLWETFEEKLKLNEEGMGKYSLNNFPLSPKSYGKPTDIQSQTSSKSKHMFKGTFVSAGALEEENEDKDILGWLYKDEDKTIETTKKVNIPIKQYGKGYEIIQKMGYEGKGPIGKQHQGISKPICLHSQSMEDKSSLGYLKSNQKQHNTQQQKWRKKSVSKGDNWQEKLHQAAKTVTSKQKKQEEHGKKEEETIIKEEEKYCQQVLEIQTKEIFEQDILEVVKIEMTEIRELFAPYDIPVWYGGVILDQDSEIDSNEYEWGPEALSTTSNKEHNEDQAAITKEDLSITEQKIKLERRQEKLKIQRKEAYAKRKENDKNNDTMPQEAQTRIKYARTIEEIRDSQVGLTISPEEAKFERRQNLLKESSLSCTQVHQLQTANEVNQEEICNTKDVCVDIIHSF